MSSESGEEEKSVSAEMRISQYLRRGNRKKLKGVNAAVVRVRTAPEIVKLVEFVALI